jgi:dolichol-phosphate mannosyltransferase
MVAKKLISIVIPAYNEEACTAPLERGINGIIDSLPQYDFEVIIVENGSYDRTYEQLMEIHQRDGRYKIVKLTRNVGPENAICAGLQFARGDAAIITYADLEDPPHLMRDFIAKWEEGYKHVYGITRQRQGSRLRRFNSQLFYTIINRLTNNVVPKNVADFRLVDRQVYQEINLITEKNRFLRGLFAWLNYKSFGIEYDRNTTRAGGESKASTLVVLALALKAIFSYSNFPLKIASILGGVTGVLSLLAILYFIVQYLFFSNFPFSGFGTIVVLMLLMFSILFFLIGILGEYVALIYSEVKGRPLFVVDELVGIRP